MRRGKTSGQKMPAQKSPDSRLPLRSASTASDADSAAYSNSTLRSRALRPQQYSMFTQHILTPRRITIDPTKRITPSAFAHFRTQKPASYHSLAQLEKVGVLLGLRKDQDKEIAAQYGFMDSKRLCEAEFSTYAMETFFLGEPRSIAPPEDRMWRAERMLQLVCPPAATSHWLSPPLLEFDVTRSDDYTWDVRPDCAYWISTRGFNEEYVHHVQNVCFVHQAWILCPYLTIEFKRDHEDISAAQTQAVSAGATALYNRYELHRRANPEAAGVGGLPAAVVHYAITFTGSYYTIWELSPNDVPESGTWNGCCMASLDEGNCTRAFDVNRLVDWINEIHRWGLMTHAPACEADVKRVLDREGVEVSVIE